MCGIVGHVTPNAPRAQHANVLLASKRLQHRGPDGDGITDWPEACLAHRRLSIIDIQHSQQPWISEDGRYAMVFNGEIYNYQELREQLTKHGVQFRSQGDTEVLFQVYLNFGAEGLNMLNGMFAFAVWDRHDNSLFIARDRLGKKPLYYAEFDHGLAFASEINALRQIEGINTQINPHAMHDFFAYQFIPGNRSIYSGINKLPPAHYLTFSAGGLKVQRYWSVPHPHGKTRNIQMLGDELRELLEESVRIRLRSDVPLGAFLSGGIDSAVIVASMKKLGVTADTFTIGFTEETFDETDTARQTADFIGTRHHQSILQQSPAILPDNWLQSFGEPFADHSAIPVWHVCEFARQHVTVALSGDGGDELFAGYRRYRGRQLLEKYRLLPTPIKKTIATLARKLPADDKYYAASLPKKINLFLAMYQRLAESPDDLNPQVFSASERNRLLGVEPAPSSLRNSIKDFELAGVDIISQMQITDINNYLAEDILSKVDRMSMAHGLEVRAPLLDYRLVEFIAKLPINVKIRGGVQKYLLKQAFRDELPPDIITRKKQGFNLPTSGWLKGALKLHAEETILHNMPDMLDRDYLSTLWLQHQNNQQDHGAKLWTLYVFGLWYHSIYQQT